MAAGLVQASSNYTFELAGENSIVIKPNISRTKAKAWPNKMAVVDAYVFDDESVERLMAIEVEVDPVTQDSSIFDKVMDWVGKK